MATFLGPRLGPLLLAAAAAIAVPAGLGWSPPWTVREERPGDYTVGLEPRTLRVATTRAIYVDIATGADANPGTNPLLPKKSIWSALNLWANDTIYVKAGWYPVANSWTGGVPFGANVNVIGVEDFTSRRPGRVVSSVSEDVAALSWTDAGAGVWTAAVANAPYAVVDLAGGAPTWFSLAAAAGDVNVAGEYHHGGGTLTVATLTGAAPPTTLRVLRNAVHNGWVNTALDMTVEGIEFEGGGNLRSFFAQSCGVLSFVRCGFTLSEAEGFGLQTSAAGVTHTVHHVGTLARWNTNDGVQYTCTGAGTTAHILEWNCEMTANGRTAGSNQGSTAHFTAGNTAIVVIRVGGRYFANEAQEIADVGGCLVWMVGPLLSGGGASAGTGFYLGDAATAWLRGVVINNCAVDIETDNAGGTVNVYGCRYRTTSGPGAVLFTL